MDDYKNKKYAIILGRAIDGVGCTRVAVEHWTWCKRNGIDLEIFAHVGKKMSRHNSMNFDYVGYKEKDLDDIQKRLNEKDVIMFWSYPYAKFSHSYAKNFYEKIVKGVTNPIKVGFIYELHKAFIDKIPYLVGIMNNMDVIYGYGPNTWFNKSMSAIFPSKKDRVLRMTHIVDFEEMKKYRNENPHTDRKIMFCGRWTTTKDPSRLLNMAPYIKKLDPNFQVKIMGMEKSRGAKDDIYDNPYCIDMTDPNKGPQPNEKGCAEVYKEYVHADAMKELSNSMFAFSGFHLKESEYSDRMESAMMEYFNAGAIPVLDIDWAKHNHLVKTNGETYYDYNLKHPFMLVSDKNDLEKTAKEIIELSTNVEKQKEMIKNGYEIVVNEFSADKVVPEEFKEILELGKDKDKFKTDEDLIRYLIDDEFVDEYLELFKEYNDKNIVVFGVRELYEKNIFGIVEGNKEIDIKEFKKSKRKKKA